MDSISGGNDRTPEKKDISHDLSGGAHRDSSRFPWQPDGNSQTGWNVDDGSKPGEHILQLLFLKFCAVAEKKVEQVLAEPLVSYTC